MNKTVVLACSVAAFCLTTTYASAGIYSDEMAKCLVKSSTADDQTLLVQWIFSAMAAHPAVKPMTNVTAEQQTDFNRKVADLAQRLTIIDCHKETVDALKYEGTASFEQSFSILGQVAMRGMMSNPLVAADLGALSGFMDRKKIEALAKEAGLPVSPPSPASAPPQSTPTPQ